MDTHRDVNYQVATTLPYSSSPSKVGDKVDMIIDAISEKLDIIDCDRNDSDRLLTMFINVQGFKDDSLDLIDIVSVNRTIKLAEEARSFASEDERVRFTVKLKGLIFLNLILQLNPVPVFGLGPV
jgi:hypothetical protein